MTAERRAALCAAAAAISVAEAPQRLRLLTFTTLYPNAAQPTHGVFVETRLRQLVGTGRATSTVLAPVPWFPIASPRFGVWGLHAAAPRHEERHGLSVHHPRFAALPRIGMSISPFSLYLAAAGALARMIADGLRVDAIDAHYLYPDGVAAVRLGRRFRLPVVLTARGSDTSLLPRYAVPRRLIQGAVAGADGIIAVSAGIKDALIGLGAAPDKVAVLRNGVDLDAFRPVADRAGLRAELGLGSAPTLLSVGHLIERKGHDLIIEALPSLPGHVLMVVGDGPERQCLLAQAERLGVTARVRLLGAQPQAKLPQFYTAADALVLASSREGWANVLLEAMACGTPVVASPAWGSREAVSSPAAGLVLEERSPQAIAAGVLRLLGSPRDRDATRAHAARFGWDETSAGQLEVFHRVLAP